MAVTDFPAFFFHFLKISAISCHDKTPPEPSEARFWRRGSSVGQSAGEFCRTVGGGVLSDSRRGSSVGQSAGSSVGLFEPYNRASGLNLKYCLHRNRPTGEVLFTRPNSVGTINPR
jgi:hypothetical protein